MNNTEINLTLQDLQVIAQYRNGDRFAVREGRLILDKQGVWQGLARAVKNIRFGGYNRNVVTNYMEEIAGRVEQLPQVQLEQNAQQLIRLSTVVSDIQYIYRPQLFSFQSKEPSERMSKVYDRIHEVTKGLNFSHPPETDFNQLDLSDPTFPVFYKPPKGIAPERIVQLSEELSSQRVGRIKRIVMEIFKNIAFIFSAPLLGLAGGLKIFIWNPIELLCRGEIRTRSPISWVIDQLFRNSFGKPLDERKMERYRNWLFHGEEINGAHLEAFAKLSWIGKTLDLVTFQVEVKNLDELKLALKEFGYTKSLQVIENSDELQTRLKQDFEGKRISLMPLLISSSGNTCESSFLKKYVQCEWKQLPKIIEKRKSLSYSQVKLVIEVAIKHRECREIELPSSFIAKGEILSLLEQAGFHRGKQDDWIYRR